MQPYVIGIDIGTGSTKAVAINSSGEIITSSQFYYPVISGLVEGYAELDTTLIWEAFVNCLKHITVSLQRTPFAVSLSSCMHGLIVIDNKQRQLTNLITWADTRSEKVADEIRKSLGAESLYRATGTPIHSMSPLCKIIWLKNNAPEIFEKAFKFISIKEFIWHRLFNVYQIDYSVACGTGLFNIEKRDWNNASLKMAGITADQLSETVSTKYLRTDLNSLSASLLNISPGTPFCIGASDGCLANAGSFAIKPGLAAVTIGTSGAVRIANATPVFNFHAMIFNYILDETKFICGSPLNNGGSVMQWLFKSFLNNTKPAAHDYVNLFKIVETIPAGCNRLLFLSYLNGERAPIWDEKACGVYFGIKSYHTHGHFFRAALEGVCYSLNEVLQIVEQSTGLVKQLNVSGGFVNSKVWMQMLSDVTGKKICVLQTEDASAVGAALLGMIALKMVDGYESLKPSDNFTIEPNVNNHEIYKKYFSVFKTLYHPLKESMHQLHQINS
jgi:gluconokinase